MQYLHRKVMFLTSQGSSRSRTPRRRSMGNRDGRARACIVGRYGRADAVFKDIPWNCFRHHETEVPNKFTFARSRAKRRHLLLSPAFFPTKTNNSQIQSTT